MIVELDDFDTSQEKKNGRMNVAICDVRSAMFKMSVRWTVLSKYIGVPTRHSGQVCSGSDHFSQVDKLARTLAYRTYHSHAVTVNTFQKGRLHEYCKHYKLAPAIACRSGRRADEGQTPPPLKNKKRKQKNLCLRSEFRATILSLSFTHKDTQTHTHTLQFA